MLCSLVQVPRAVPPGEKAAAEYFAGRRAAGGFDKMTLFRKNHAETLSQLQAYASATVTATATVTASATIAATEALCWPWPFGD